MHRCRDAPAEQPVDGGHDARTNTGGLITTKDESLASRLRALRNVVGLTPDNHDAWLDLAEIWSWVGNHLAAEADLKREIERVRALQEELAQG